MKPRGDQMNIKEIMCVYLGLDYTELKHYRYQATQTSAPVYAIEDKYYSTKKATNRDGSTWNWKPIEFQGVTFYCASEESES